MRFCFFLGASSNSSFGILRPFAPAGTAATFIAAFFFFFFTDFFFGLAGSSALPPFLYVLRASFIAWEYLYFASFAF